MFCPPVFAGGQLYTIKQKGVQIYEIIHTLDRRKKSARQ